MSLSQKKSKLKKAILIFSQVFFLSQNLFSQVNQTKDSIYNFVPPLLSGIWQNESRYVILDTAYVSKLNLGEDDFIDSKIPQIVLRTFYRYYNDRAAESHLYSQENSRDVNSATQKSAAQELQISFLPLVDAVYPETYNLPVQKENQTLYAENLPSGAWILKIKYPNDKTIYNVPLCVIGDKMYLNFAIKVENFNSDFENPQSKFENSAVLEENPQVLSANQQNNQQIQENPQISNQNINGFWQDYGIANGILICPPTNKSELLSYYVDDDKIYKIRYWQTDMEFDSSAKASFSDDNKTFYVPKHIKIADKTFTCTVGRRTKIRNIEKSSSFEKKCTFNSVLVQTSYFDQENQQTLSFTSKTSTICAFGDAYLTLSDGTRTIEEIIENQNSQKKPSPAPLFPPKGILEFDWSIIERPPSDYNRRNLDLGK